MAENKSKKLKLKFIFNNRTIELIEGVLDIAYDARLNIITFNGVINEKIIKLLMI